MKKFYLVTLIIFTIAFVMPTCYAAEPSSSALQNIGYIGDYTKCKLTAAQADSYANIIENITIDDFTDELTYSVDSWLYEYYNVYGSRYNAVLADISGDGVPILLLFCEVPPVNQDFQNLGDSSSFDEHPVFMLIYHLMGDRAIPFSNNRAQEDGGFYSIGIVPYKNESFLYGFTDHSDVSSEYFYFLRAENGNLSYAHKMAHEIEEFELPPDINAGWIEVYESIYTRTSFDGYIVDWSSIESIQNTVSEVFVEYSSGGFYYGEKFPGRSKTQANLVITALRNYARSIAISPIAISLNGRIIESEVPPRIIDGRTMVPVRAVTEALGCIVEWEDEYKMVYVFMPSGDPLMAMRIGEPVATVHNLDADGNYILDGKYDPIYRATVESPPVIIDGRTFVPLRFIAEAMSFSVEWEESTRTVYLVGFVGY